MNKKTRRNLIKGLAVAAPVVWVKPVVDSVVLPAHAQTSIPIEASVRFFTDDSFNIEIPNGSTIVIGTPYVVLITLFPIPGIPLDLVITTSINGVPNAPANGTTTPGGELAFQVPAAGDNNPANDGKIESFDTIENLTADNNFGPFTFADIFFIAFEGI